jgi:four helix bundle protein
MGNSMADNNVQGLDSLEAWTKSMELALRVYKEVLPLLPSSEKWNLQEQIRRAVASVPANIAEGHGRHYYQENVHFCYIARGSLTEVYSHVTLAYRLGFIPGDKYQDLKLSIADLTRLVNGYIAFLKRVKTGANEPGAGMLVHEPSAPYVAPSPEDPPPGEDY